MKQNKVAVNLAQDFTDAEKLQARNNIGASDGKISWVEYNEGHPTPTVDTSFLSVVTSDTGTRIQNNDSTKKFYVAPNFSTADNNKVLTIKDSKVQWATPVDEGDKIDFFQHTLANDSSNTTVLDRLFVGNDYKEYSGNIGFTTTSSGNMSICAFNANEQLIYGSQCVNFTGPTTGVTNFVPFMFKETGTDKISFIGIKGSSNGNANITHLFYLGKKE